MGGRDLPVDCDRCGKVLDWGDFGPEEGDCTCEPLECICRSWIEHRAAGPVTATEFYPSCALHGREADPDRWPTGKRKRMYRTVDERDTRRKPSMTHDLPPHELRRVHGINLAIAYYRDLAKTRLVLPKRDDADLAVEVKPEVSELLDTAAGFADFIANGLIPNP